VPVGVRLFLAKECDAATYSIYEWPKQLLAPSLVIVPLISLFGLYLRADHPGALLKRQYDPISSLSRDWIPRFVSIKDIDKQGMNYLLVGLLDRNFAMI
jgi:hypothetical protein